MSFATLAFRIATVRALRGQTVVGNFVLDEPVNPEEHVLTGSDGDTQARPIIAVYTNLTTAKVMGNDLLASESKVELTLQIYLPYVVTNGTTRIVGRDAGGKLQTDIIERQILRVFLNADTPWAQLRRDLSFQYEEVRSQSFIMATNSKYEIAAREIVYRCELIAEPNFGAQQPEIFSRFLTLVEQDPDLNPIHGLLQAELVGTQQEGDWRLLMAELGATQASTNGIGLTLGMMGSPENAPPLTQITIGNESGGGVVIDDGTHEAP